jgi:hypothetical protein
VSIELKARSCVGQLRRLYFGFAIGVIFVTLATSCQEVAVLCKVIYVILFLGLLTTAALWPKLVSYEGPELY